jgi:hypothetical protein
VRVPKEDHPDADNWYNVRRRKVLGATVAASTGSAAGCTGQSNTKQTARTRQNKLPSHDHGGESLGKSEPVTDLTVARITGSRREGDTVFYHPDQRGPYPDGEAAFDDVPPSGTFVLEHGRYDVAEEGRLVRDKPVNIRGSGWQRDNDGDTPVYRGSVFVNTGDDVIDEPVIDCRTQGDRGADWALQNTIKDVGIIHEGPTSPAIRLHNFVFTTIADCGVECRGKGAKGVSFEEAGFFSRMVRSQVKGATDICVHVSGIGYAHEFYSNHISIGADDGRAALQTERHRTIVVGGEHIGTAETPGIRFYNPGTDGLEEGGLVLEPGLEKDAWIEIDGEVPFNDVQMYHTKLPPIGEDKPSVKFGNTRKSKLIHPVVYPQVRARGTPFAKWTEQAAHCGIITDAETLRGLNYIDEGATNPYIHLQGRGTPEQISDIKTDVPISIDHHGGASAPAVHDGSQWRVASMDPIE